jgi:hypothetical protein
MVWPHSINEFQRRWHTTKIQADKFSFWWHNVGDDEYICTVILNVDICLIFDVPHEARGSTFRV